MKITNIQDDGNKFIIHGTEGIFQKLKETFDQMSLGISVTQSKEAEAHILYTENNRDIVLEVLSSHTK